MEGQKNNVDFESLVRHIQRVDHALRMDTHVVINRNVTTRAWLTGCYVVEYEQNGSDRAKYGEHLLQNLSKRLGGKSYSVTNLRSYRLFYMYYPEMRPVIGSYLQERFGGKDGSAESVLLPEGIQQTLSAELGASGKQQTPSAELVSQGGVPSVVGVSSDGFAMSLSDGSVKAAPQMIFDRLSFSHVVSLAHVGDDLQNKAQEL